MQQQTPDFVMAPDFVVTNFLNTTLYMKVKKLKEGSKCASNNSPIVIHVMKDGKDTR